MNKILVLGLAAAASLGAVSATQAAGMEKINGNWSTWGCNVSWFDIGDGSLTRYSKEERLPDNLVSKHDANITQDGNKLTIDYKWLGSDYKYTYNVMGDNNLLLDRLVVDKSVAFDRDNSNSRFKDRETSRCSPSA